MSRGFLGSASDYVAFSAGAAASIDGGPISCAVVWRADLSANHWLVQALTAANGEVWALNPYGGDGHCYWSSGGGFSQLDAWVANRWYATVVTKVNGSATVRSHTYDFTAGTWAHADHDTLGDSAGPVATVRLGGPVGHADNLTGFIAAAGIWSSVLTDGQIETMHTGIAAWSALSPVTLWSLNQSEAVPLVDLTGGGADQSAISGTQDEAVDPPGWSYVIGGNTVSGTLSAPLGGLTATITGHRTVHGTATATLGGLTATVAGHRTVHGTVTAALGGLRASITVVPTILPGRLTAGGTAAHLAATGTP